MIHTKDKFDYKAVPSANRCHVRGIVMRLTGTIAVLSFVQHSRVALPSRALSKNPSHLIRLHNYTEPETGAREKPKRNQGRQKRDLPVATDRSHTLPTYISRFCPSSSSSPVLAPNPVYQALFPTVKKQKGKKSSSPELKEGKHCIEAYGWDMS